VSVNGAIARLAALFVAAYVLLFARQIYVQVVVGPGLATNGHNPRASSLGAYRGAILARDGTVLAKSDRHGRQYPLGASLAQTVGYASARYGTSGLEAAFDDRLRARPVANDPVAQIAQLAHPRRWAPALPGATVVTTLDPRVQATLYASLAKYPRAAGIALDPRTGAVLAMASVPSFDPATLDRTFATVAHDERSPLLNRSIDGLYPPGSTFKIFTAGAALETGAIAADETFVDDGALRVGNATVQDNEGESTGTQDLTGAFAQSSNVDFAQIALKLGLDRWFAQANRWRFGAPLDFTLPAQRDRLPSKASVSPSILAQLGFGQADLLVTPMRMALVAATVAAGGAEPRPYLVRAVRANGRDETAVPPGTLARPISGDVAGRLRDMMVAVVERGTGRNAALPDVTVAGKTGTATNPAGKSHAWFVAFAPAGDPHVAVAIVVENAGYGGDVAAPIARRVIAAALTGERNAP
jgi:peptidoglycan glycosyltransferase